MRFIGMSAAVLMAAASALPAMAQTVYVAPGTVVTTTTVPMVSSGQAPTTNNSTVYGNPKAGGCTEGDAASCPPGVNPLTQGGSAAKN